MVDRADRVAELAADWEQLDTAIAGPMASFGWASAAALSLAKEQTLFVIVASRNGAVRAIAPLARCRGLGLGRLEILGLGRMNEPTDLIYADREGLAEVVSAAVRLRRPLLLGRIPEGSPTIETIRSACRGRAVVMVRPRASCPFIPLDESWREPESHLSSRRRSDLRRAQRHAEKLGGVRAEILTPRRDELDELLRIAFEVEARSWKGAAGTALANDPVRSRFLHEFAAWAVEAGTLRICLLRIGDTYAAMQIAVEQANRFWLLKIGFDPAFAKCSPGNLLLAASIRYSAERRLESLEFLGTVESWTRVWTEQERRCVSVRVYPLGFRGGAALACDAAAALRDRWRERSKIKAQLAEVVEDEK